MNRSVQDVGGAVLAVSQFTLYADVRRGNRPGFGEAAEPALGEELVAAFGDELRALGLVVAEGRFGAHMQVELVNDWACHDLDRRRLGEQRPRFTSRRRAPWSW